MRMVTIIMLSCIVASAQVEYVREDAMTFKATYYAPLDTTTMSQYWAQTAINSERIYNGDGSWGLGFSDWPTKPYDADHPLVRVVARHCKGLLTLVENGLADSSMTERLRMSLNWMMARQTDEGAWPIYTSNRGSISTQSVTPTALAGQAMSHGYRVLGNPRYLIAANMGLEWQRQRPDVQSAWFHGLFMAQLIEQYDTIHESDILDEALQEFSYLESRQLPNGSWTDNHPLTTGEHAVITTALLNLERNLTDIHPMKRRLFGTVNAAINFLLENQLKEGRFTSAAVEVTTRKTPSYEIVALIKAREQRAMEEFDMPITGAIRALNSVDAATEIVWRATQDGRFMAMSYALIWFTAHPPKHEEMAPNTAPDTTDSRSARSPVSGL